MWRWGLVLVLLASCSGADAPVDAPGPGFAVEGSLESDFTVYLYRFEGDVVVQFHPNGGVVLVEAPGEGDVCEVDVGFQPGPRKPRDCVPLRDGKVTVDMQNATAEHVALMLRTGRTEEATLRYRPLDNFLAVDFP